MVTRMDVSNNKDVHAVFDKIMTKYHTAPNVVVNVAGILKDNFLLNISEEEFRDVFNVNLKVNIPKFSLISVKL